MIQTGLTGLYGLSVLLLALYTAGQAILLIQYWRHRHTPSPDVPVPPDDALPAVTVQLPVYNERHVILRLLGAVAALDYPVDKLLIQVLDDSTDETQHLIQEQVALLRRAGRRVQHLRRAQREGYKAGALAYGMTHTDDDYLLILDADFVPAPDFLRRTLPHLLADERTGVVQTRWSHLNHDANWLTRAQTLAIDAHFMIEQSARSYSGWLLPFNGTGGIWRRACIEDAGGWSHRTLTEDLDLSYRAQLRGWRTCYLPQVSVPGEIPPRLADYRQQQARWATGSTQCLRHLAIPVWQSSRSLSSRLMALHHLCQYLPQPLILLLLILTPLMLLTGAPQGIPLTIPGLLVLVPPLMYLLSQRSLYPDWRSRLRAFPMLLLLGTGMIWSNTRAVFRGLSNTSDASIFRRTPKYGAHSPISLSSDLRPRMEWVWMLYALLGAGLAWRYDPAVMGYMLIYAASFAAVIRWEWRDTQRSPVIPATKQADSQADRSRVLFKTFDRQPQQEDLHVTRH